MNRIRSIIFNNFLYKLLALLLAAVIWVMVTGINDPVKQSRFSNIPVTLENTSLITDKGMVYTVLDNSDVIPVVYVKAQRSVIESIDRDNIVAVANVENLSSVDTIEVQFSSNKRDSEIESITGSISTVKLSIEEKKTSSFPLRVETSGKVASGYQLGSIQPEQNQVRVSGPESVVSKIASAVATVDVTEASGSITTYSDVRLYDIEGNLVSAANLTMNITSVKVAVNVLPIKDIPITVETKGEPADGYMLDGTITVEPKTVGLAGKSSVLSSVDSIVIPAGVIDVTGATSDYERDIDITPYLPEGLTFEDTSFNGYVHVTVGIEPSETVALEMNLDDVLLINVPDGVNARVISLNDGERSTISSEDINSVNLEISGLASQVDGIKLEDLKPEVDVSAILDKTDDEDKAGAYPAQVKITLPVGISEENSVVAVVRIDKAGGVVEQEPAVSEGTQTDS